MNQKVKIIKGYMGRWYIVRPAAAGAVNGYALRGWWTATPYEWAPCGPDGRPLVTYVQGSATEAEAQQFCEAHGLSV